MAALLPHAETQLGQFHHSLATVHQTALSGDASITQSLAGHSARFIVGVCAWCKAHPANPVYCSPRCDATASTKGWANGVPPQPGATAVAVAWPCKIGHVRPMQGETSA